MDTVPHKIDTLKMRLEVEEEKLGNVVYEICWISLAHRFRRLTRNTEEEAIAQVKHLLKLGFRLRDIAVYRACKIVTKQGADKHGKKN